MFFEKKARRSCAHGSTTVGGALALRNNARGARPNTPINQNNIATLRTACCARWVARAKFMQPTKRRHPPQARHAVRWPRWYLRTNAMNYKSQVLIMQTGRWMHWVSRASVEQQRGAMWLFQIVVRACK